MAVNVILNKKNGKLTVTKPVSEWLFDGYEDELLQFIKVINSTAFDVPYDKFGWFVDRNKSAGYDGRFNMYTGHKDATRLGIVSMWNGRSSVPFYKNGCGMINGTTGELWPQQLESNESISIFITDVCRSLPLMHQDEYELFGITAKRWTADGRVFDNGQNHPDAMCFCTNDADSCPDLQPGVMNLSDCQFGAPAFVSFPHFYLANESYLEAIDGLQPNKEDHEFSISLEPKTGIPMQVNGRLQINILLQPLSHIE